MVLVEAFALGQVAFGESYAQEAAEKIAAVRALLAPAGAVANRPDLVRVVSGERQLSAPSSLALAPQWHFIGPIQSNKTHVLAEQFDWVQSIDRLKVAQRLSDQRPAGLPPLQVCIQVNISAEATKGGVEPDAVSSLVAQVAALPRLRLRGLMAIPAPTSDVSRQRRAFRRLRELLESLISSGWQLDTLSMGMSDDLEAAVAEGATMVRVGRAIFGERT